MHQTYGTCAGGWHNVYLAPLKVADIDSEGTMRLKYWKGNDALLGEKVTVTLTEPHHQQHQQQLRQHQYQQHHDNHYHIQHSSSTDVSTAATASKPAMAAPPPLPTSPTPTATTLVRNISAPCNNGNGTVIFGKAANGDGSVIFYGSHGISEESIEMGIDATGIMYVWTQKNAAAERLVFEKIDRAMTFGGAAAVVEWRVLMRGSMVEVYVNDVLILPLPLRNTVTASGGLARWAAGVRAPTVLVGLNGTWAESEELQVRTMTLPVLFPM
jgi:hypothetical protein